MKGQGQASKEVGEGRYKSKASTEMRVDCEVEKQREVVKRGAGNMVAHLQARWRAVELVQGNTSAPAYAD